MNKISAPRSTRTARPTGETLDPASAVARVMRRMPNVMARLAN